MLPDRKRRIPASALNRIKLELNLNVAGAEFFGVLGDISRDGLQAVVFRVEGANIATEVGAKIVGELLGKELVVEMRFEGRVAWQDNREFKGAPAWLLGIEFQGAPCELPQEITSLLSAD